VFGAPACQCEVARRKRELGNKMYEASIHTRCMRPLCTRSVSGLHPHQVYQASIHTKCIRPLSTPSVFYPHQVYQASIHTKCIRPLSTAVTVAPQATGLLSNEDVRDSCLCQHVRGSRLRWWLITGHHGLSRFLFMCTIAF